MTYLFKYRYVHDNVISTIDKYEIITGTDIDDAFMQFYENRGPFEGIDSSILNRMFSDLGVLDMVGVMKALTKFEILAVYKNLEIYYSEPEDVDA